MLLSRLMSLGYFLGFGAGIIGSFIYSIKLYFAVKYENSLDQLLHKSKGLVANFHLYRWFAVMVIGWSLVYLCR